MFRVLKSETAVTIFFTAIMTSIGAMIVSPLSISLGFMLNDYLARPILSIEYVEIITRMKEIKIPKSDISNLVVDDYFLMSEIDDQVTSSVMTNMKEAEKNLEGVLRLIETLSEIEQYVVSDIEKQKKKFNITVIKNGSPSFHNEIEKIHKYKDKLKDVINHLKEIKSLSIEDIYLKVSLLNKGNTDGLIRSSGQLLNKNGEKYIIQGTDAPKNKNLMAIAVTVVNDSFVSESGRSVGKIEMHSMKEFWYKIKKNNGHDKILEKFYSDIKNDNKIEMILFDHENSQLNKSFVLSE